MASIVVSGAMLRRPFAGNVATCLHYLVGLQMLGHEVLYVEEKGWANSCFDPASCTVGGFPRTGLALARELLRRQRADVPVVWVDPCAGLVEGMLWPQLRERFRRADLLLDIGGPLRLEERALPRRRALVDTDLSLVHTGASAARSRLDDYDLRFTYGLNLAEGARGVAAAAGDGGWLATLPPVVPRLWRAPPPQPHLPVTSVLEWSAHGPAGRGAVWHGQRNRELERLLTLPARVPVALELALSGEGAEVRERFASAGWFVRDGAQVTASLAAYRAYIGCSQAQLSTADPLHVATCSGRLDDRSVCYLAAGRPVIAQDTGIGEWLDTGTGLLTFSSPDEAAEAVRRVAADLDRHSLAARTLAREVFHFGVVLRRLLARALPRRLQAVA